MDLADQVEKFKDLRPSFEALTKILIATLKLGTADITGVMAVQGRVKAISSFAEKCIRKKHKYQQPARELTDLCGVRVIVESRDAIEPVRRFIEEHFEIDENEDTGERLKDMEFGYQSVHYIVSLKEDVRELYLTSPKENRKEQSHLPGMTAQEMLDSLLQRRGALEAKAADLPIGPVFKAEIQVRSLLQHAWAAIIHDNLYKTEMKEKPRHLLRESGRIAAQLENADEAFSRLLRGIKDYRSYYGAYMTPKEIKEEVAAQKDILAQDPENSQIALKMARLVYSLDDISLTKEVEPILSRFEDREDANVHRELGVVRWKLGKPEGRSNLLRSTKLDPADPENWCELGRTYFDQGDYWHAFDAYESAFRLAPEYPRALLRYIECRILRFGDFSFIPLIRHNLERAIEVSRKRIAAGLHLPYAWYDIGFFQLLLGNPYQSLDAYGKAVLATSSEAKTLVDSVYNSLTEIHRKAVDAKAELSDHLNWVRSFLKVVLVGRLKHLSDELLRVAEPRLDGFNSLTVCADSKEPSLFKPGDNVVIVAGACAPSSEKLISDYRPLIHFAFEGFKGTVCCGGTKAGISGIIGDLPDPEGQIKKIAYLPEGRPGKDQEHPGYKGHVVRTDSPSSRGYSALDPIMLWSDLLASGVKPADVRVLGVSGGELAGFEYRLALLLEAKVGVLPESGRAASDLAHDPDWANGCLKYLVSLPTDRETIRVFIQPTHQSEMLDSKTRTMMARDAHEKDYRIYALADLLQKEHKELVEWESLEETFKRANLDQVDHIDEKLRRIGLKMRRATGKPVVFRLSDDQISLLAEMEHGRWNVDRLLDGWTFGKDRDHKKKTRPQLIPWKDLPPEEKEKDFKFIRALPAKLASYGYELYKTDKDVPEDNRTPSL